MNLLRLINESIAAKKQIAVVGLGISGIEAAHFLERVGASYLCFEGLEQALYLEKNPHAKKTKDLKNVIWGVDQRALPDLTSVSLAIVSPGYSQTKPIVLALKEKGIPIVTEFELGLLLYQKPTILVTGSNGKSTVVSLIHHLLKSVGVRSLLVGNIGTPVISGITSLEIPPSDIDLLVVEASSYQLELCGYFTPKIAVFLNLSPNHLERHGSMEAYYNAKASVFRRIENKKNAIINGADPYGKRLLSEIGGSDLSDFVIDWSDKSDPTGLNIKLKGKHSLINIKAALFACEAFGIRKQELIPHLKTFLPLPHRYEQLPAVNGINWINDSKSTTPAATLAAVTTFFEEESGELVLLIGGLSKQGEWSEVKEALRNSRLKKVIYFGRDGAKILKELLPGEIVSTLLEAMILARKSVKEGDTVLLSPGCASFDEFTSFEARGEFFKQNIRSDINN